MKCSGHATNAIESPHVAWAPGNMSGDHSGNATGAFALTHGKRALWFLSQLDVAHAPYNISDAVRIPPRLVAENVVQTMNTLLAGHTALRASFFMGGDELRQRIRPAVEIEIPVVDAQKLGDDELRADQTGVGPT